MAVSILWITNADEIKQKLEGLLKTTTSVEAIAKKLDTSTRTLDNTYKRLTNTVKELTRAFRELNSVSGVSPSGQINVSGGRPANIGGRGLSPITSSTIGIAATIGLLKGVGGGQVAPRVAGNPVIPRPSIGGGQVLSLDPSKLPQSANVLTLNTSSNLSRRGSTLSPLDAAGRLAEGAVGLGQKAWQGSWAVRQALTSDIGGGDMRAAAGKAAGSLIALTTAITTLTKVSDRQIELARKAAEVALTTEKGIKSARQGIEDRALSGVLGMIPGQRSMSVLKQISPETAGALESQAKVWGSDFQKLGIGGTAFTGVQALVGQKLAGLKGVDKEKAANALFSAINQGMQAGFSPEQILEGISGGELRRQLRSGANDYGIRLSAGSIAKQWGMSTDEVTRSLLKRGGSFDQKQGYVSIQDRMGFLANKQAEQWGSKQGIGQAGAAMERQIQDFTGGEGRVIAEMWAELDKTAQLRLKLAQEEWVIVQGFKRIGMAFGGSGTATNQALAENRAEAQGFGAATGGRR